MEDGESDAGEIVSNGRVRIWRDTLVYDKDIDEALCYTELNMSTL
jgi:hypothetical protein